MITASINTTLPDVKTVEASLSITANTFNNTATQTSNFWLITKRSAIASRRRRSLSSTSLRKPGSQPRLTANTITNTCSKLWRTARFTKVCVQTKQPLNSKWTSLNKFTKSTNKNSKKHKASDGRKWKSYLAVATVLKLITYPTWPTNTKWTNPLWEGNVHPSRTLIPRHASK